MKSIRGLSAIIFLFIILASCSSKNNSDDSHIDNTVFQGNVLLISQAEVDEFGSNNYSGIDGNLTIFVNSTIGTTDINDLTPLSSLTFIEGDLTINSNNYLNSLNGLHNLVSIGGGMGILYNDGLQNIDALQNLQELGGDLVISNCENLLNINGLLGLNKIRGFLHIGDINTDNSNLSLQNISGLGNISSVESHIIIANNDSLTSLSGLENIANINGEIGIYENDNLQDLDGLQNLQIVNGDFVIYGNSNLQNVNQITNLTQVEGKIDIDNNPNLSSLSGFQNLINVGNFLNIGLSEGNNITPLDFESLVSALYLSLKASEINSFNSLTDTNSIFIDGWEDNLISVSGFANISSLSTLRIKYVSDINGFNFLQNVDDFILEQPSFKDPTIIINAFNLLSSINQSLSINSIANADLDFLNNLSSAGDILIQYNENLIDFCGLNNVFLNNGLNGKFFAGNNLYNPSTSDMENGNCSL